jgi:hypothetical protein
VLDFIVEVSVPAPAEFGRVRRVLGWDWGVRTLVTATVVDLSGTRLSPPLFLDTGRFGGQQAHTRKQIDGLKAKVTKLEKQRDRWVNWRNNSQIRGALWRVLRYKCLLSGLHLIWQHPQGTTHSCPRCGKPAHTYADPAPDAKQLDEGPWLRCFACGWNGARDYAAAINIALLGVAFLLQERASQEHATRSKRPTMKTKPLNSASYTGAGLALRLPPTSPRGRLLDGGKRYVNGWIKSVSLHSALSQDTMLRLCG